jgi:hypothetical protein
MATVYRGTKSRVAGVVYGLLFIALGIGLFSVVDIPLGGGSTKELLPLVILGLLVVFGLFNVGKAVFQSEYRIVVDSHRGKRKLRFGQRIFR